MTVENCKYNLRVLRSHIRLYVSVYIELEKYLKSIGAYRKTRNYYYSDKTYDFLILPFGAMLVIKKTWKKLKGKFFLNL